MVLRFLMRWLVNERTIDKLADSYPIRRAAQWTLYAFMKGKAAVEGDTQKKAIRFKDTMLQELKKEWKKASGEGTPPSKPW